MTVFCCFDLNVKLNMEDSERLCLENSKEKNNDNSS